jgi:hypothetical protein
MVFVKPKNSMQLGSGGPYASIDAEAGAAPFRKKLGPGSVCRAW